MSNVQFMPDTCLAKDPAGWGQFLNGHAFEHENFRAKALSLANPIVIPSYNIRSWRDEPEYVQSWLVTHEAIHQALRVLTGVEGSDLSQVDLADDSQFYEWLESHAQEHREFRQVLGA